MTLVSSREKLNASIIESQMVSQQYVQEAERKIEKLAEFKEIIANDLSPILDKL